MGAEIESLANYVGGAWRTSRSEVFLDVPDPASANVLRRVPMSNAEDVDAAVRAAREALPSWRATPVADRARLVRHLCALLERDTDRLAAAVTEENGKTPEEARGSVRRGLEAAEFAAAAPSLTEGSHIAGFAAGLDATSRLEPVGVVAGVSPFNFPAMIPLWMAPLALACGNTFLLKPSERVPRTAGLLADLFGEAGFPPGTFNLVHGGSGTVEAILDHPGVDAVTFVGSAPVARAVYARGCAAGKRVLALAGAKNHAIVLPDAPFESTVSAIVSSAFGVAGERCLATSVVVVVEPGDRFVEELAGAVRRLRAGAPSHPDSDLGPLIRSGHRDRVEAMIQQGIREGAALIARGSAPEGEPGFFVAPALFDRVQPSMTIAREEIFGPVLSVIRVPDLTSALTVANGSSFGNAAAIFTGDGASAQRFSREIEAGMVGINVGVPAPPAYFPFVGWKGSVFGAEAATGRGAVAFYTRSKVVLSRWPAHRP